MAVNVDEIVSSVIPEPEEQGGSSDAAGESWKKLAQLRASHAMNVWDRTRTSAEGFDD